MLVCPITYKHDTLKFKCQLVKSCMLTFPVLGVTSKRESI